MPINIAIRNEIEIRSYNINYTLNYLHTATTRLLRPILHSFKQVFKVQAMYLWTCPHHCLRNWSTGRLFVLSFVVFCWYSMSSSVSPKVLVHVWLVYILLVICHIHTFLGVCHCVSITVAITIRNAIKCWKHLYILHCDYWCDSLMLFLHVNNCSSNLLV